MKLPRLSFKSNSSDICRFMFDIGDRAEGRNPQFLLKWTECFIYFGLSIDLVAAFRVTPLDRSEVDSLNQQHLQERWCQQEARVASRWCMFNSHNHPRWSINKVSNLPKHPSSLFKEHHRDTDLLLRCAAFINSCDSDSWAELLVAFS